MVFVIAAALIAVADRLVKLFVVKNIALGESLPFLKGILELTYVRNSGAAFSMLQGMRWILAVITVVAIAAIFYVIFKKVFKSPWERWALAAIAGGAVGNLIDRVAYGYVIDMFRTTFVNFAVFNVADIFVTLGGIVFCVYLAFFSGKEEKKEK